MSVHHIVAGVATVALLTVTAGAQSLPAVRTIGPAEQVSIHVLSSVSTAVPVSGGILVNDVIEHRVLLFNADLSSAGVVADSTAASAKTYGIHDGSLIRYHGDSALFIDPGSLSMLVVSPRGQIVRNIPLTIPHPNDIVAFTGGMFGVPGFDARERLVYFAGAGQLGVPSIGEGQVLTLAIRSRLLERARPDSAFVVRVDPKTGALDTAAAFKIAHEATSINVGAGDTVRSIQVTRQPLPVVDDWAVCSDGSLAILRGRDFHVDWLGADGKWQASRPMHFDWQQLDDARKTAIADSAVKADQLRENLGRARMLASPGAPRRMGAPYIYAKPAITDLPDRAPAFTRGALHADADGNLWIRTTAIANGQPVYDIATCRGELIDRIQLPPSRTIAGFAAGVVYLAVKDSLRFTYLERVPVGTAARPLRHDDK